ncbi:ATP-binding protein [Neomegalonema sp.]|uniref:sensor histidine kinase n=1 Tax=Neomegalonema sp. TaxID=2039713 RepID=UPI002607442C|nr:ATP-binding protein [Neomegalonema sp.]MDD2869462.1 histidine kinase dimerization/phospho-acceptor domain-containing protein [Neomegalonema sp.]
MDAEMPDPAADPLPAAPHPLGARFSTRLALGLSASICAAFLGFAGVSAWREAGASAETQRALRSQLARSMAGALSQPVWNENHAMIGAIGDAAFESGVVSVRVFRHDGELLLSRAAKEGAALDEGELVIKRTPILRMVQNAPRRVGELEMVWRAPNFTQALIAQARSKLPLLLMTLAAALLMTHLLVRRLVTRPLEALGAAIEASRRAAPPAPLRMERPPPAEFGPVIHAYDHLAEEVRRRDATLATRMRELHRADEAKSRFLAMMSHELRTPLNAVIGFASIIKDEMMGEVSQPLYRDYANDIHEAGEHLLGIINDILDLTRLQQGRMEIHPSLIHASELLRAARVLGEAKASARGVRLELADRPVSLADTLRVDGRLVKQALLNLVDNAIKASPEGGAVRIWFLDRPAGGVAFVVEDSGAGFVGRDVEKLFESFSSEQNAYVRDKQTGLGLGLPISRRLMRLHGGDVAIDADAPGGGRASLELPASVVVTRRAPEAPSAVSAAV